MCGIAGIFGKHEIENFIIDRMINAIDHRGPDDSGVCTIFNGKGYLGHKRLAIVDTSSAGHQPYEFENIKLVFNGEVYNYKEIRVELIGEGYLFDSDSDTEVIVKAIHRWGKDAVNRFNGMYAIGYVDMRVNNLFLIRDRAGVKPLYWGRQGEQFFFASELKCFHENPGFSKEIDTSSLFEYFNKGYIGGSSTIFEGIFQLDGGCILEVDLETFDFTETQYWDLESCYHKPKLDLSYGESIEELDRKINDSVKLRMRSDVPLGSFLSGGYDSSLITAVMAGHSGEKIKTYTIGFDNKEYDESAYAKEVAEYLNCDHHSFVLDSKSAREYVLDLPYFFDEPIADPSVVPTMALSKLARESVTVALSSDGGDELFGGYNSYIQSLFLSNKVDSIPFSNTLSSLVNNVSSVVSEMMPKVSRRMLRVSDILQSESVSELYEAYSQVFTRSEVALLLKDRSLERVRNNGISDGISSMLIGDFNGVHRNKLLVKVDRGTMAYGLEAREPLLDVGVIEFSAQIPDSFKIENGVGKRILKDLAHSYLPKSLLDRPKMGFSVPIQDWFEGSLDELVSTYMSQSYILRQGLFSEKQVENLLFGYSKGIVNFRQLWCFISFQMWYDRWM